MDGAMKIPYSDGLSAMLRTFRPSPEVNHPILIALVAATLAAGVRFSLDPLLHEHSPFLFFAIAVVIAALYGDIWAGIGATLLTVPLCDYLFIEPRYTWFIHDARRDSIMLGVFIALGVLMILVIHRFHLARTRLRQSLIALQQSEAKLEMITATVPEILFTSTAEGAAEYLNKHFSEYSGRELSALVGHGWLDLIHPADRAGMEAELSTRLKLRDQFETVFRLRGHDGAYRWFKWHAKPLSDSDGAVEKWFGVCSDIDNEKKLADALASRTEELARLNEGLERFAYTASHDLQEPLRTIGAMTELLLSRAGGTLDTESSGLLASVVNGVQRMRRLIRDIMEFAKATNTSGDLGDVDACAIAELAIANLNQAIKLCQILDAHTLRERLQLFL